MNPESSSEGSSDEEVIVKLFDKEEKSVVHNQAMPKKSADRYLLVYNAYKKWKEDNKSSLSLCEEDNLIVYFQNLREKLSPSTLWSVWSMLNKTLYTHENINIGNFVNLKNMIKINSKGHKPKKSLILKWEQITKFINEAHDEQYLAMKVVLIFGICGCLRCDEITNIRFEDIEDLNDKFLVSIKDNKNGYPGQFIIGDLFYQVVKKYISLRPEGEFSDRFFIHYARGKCSRSPIGRHTIGAMPKKIAAYLKLTNINRYTGHCFRRSSATLLANSGANMTMLKQLGKWRLDIIAQGYVENSSHNKQTISNGFTQKIKLEDTQSEPSTSEVESKNLLNDEFILDDAEIISTEDVEHIVSSGKPLPVPFMEEPAMNTVSNVHPPPSKKPKRVENAVFENMDDINLSTEEHGQIFSNCTFNNCRITINKCNCSKDVI